ncbi:MAG: redoxin family protein, partial [Planctomycetes bacterium]|nr:redoxin family protein [Planctomycetota bacterium]
MNLPLTHAPDFPYHFQWFNTPQPLTLHDELTGYVVLVYFWTPTSAHCQSMFPTVAYLGQRFAGRAFVAIGVHAARFAAEADLELIGRALRRYGIRHPVVVDEHRHLWEEYGCRGWPHSVLVDATGTVRFSGSGEPDRERMAAAIEFLLDDAAAQGDEPYTHLRFSDTEPPEGLSGLSAPAGIAADPRRGLLWVADTGHHRVVAVDVESGQVTVVVGCGEPGAGDGSFDQATFFLPRALALHGDGVLVADTGNHLVRRLDPSTRQVTTVLGTGRSVADPHAGAAGRAQPLHAPQGLAAAADAVFVAVA